MYFPSPWLPVVITCMLLLGSVYFQIVKVKEEMPRQVSGMLSNFSASL